MDWKKLVKSLLFPHVVIRALLVPIATALLIWAMIALGSNSPFAIASYVLAAYTLTVWCFKIPSIVRFFQTFKTENRYARRWQEDARLRVNVSLYGALAWNILYGAFQLWLGVYHHTFWFASLGAYYVCLAGMRFFLVQHSRKFSPGENMQAELKKYRACGWIFLLMNLALALIIFFMVYWNRTFKHHMITTIAMAAYTFTACAVAIVNMVKYRKYNSPVFSASKSIALTAALVSILTLESTMLTTFGKETMTQAQQKWMLMGTGAAITAAIVALAIYMIVTGTKKLRILKTEVKHGT